MNPVMYILSDPSLEMSPGKLAAQCSHAAVEAYRLSCKRGVVTGTWRANAAAFEESSIANRWRRGGHYAKIVLQADDLRTAAEYITARGFNCVPIIDEGRTEFDGELTMTAVGVEIVDKDSGHVRDTFSAFKLYRDKDRPLSEEEFDRLRALGTATKPRGGYLGRHFFNRK